MKELYDYIVTKQNYDSTRAYRIKKYSLSSLSASDNATKRLFFPFARLLGNTYFFEDEYRLTLREIPSFLDGGVRLRIERGQTPKRGNVVLTLRNESKLKTKENPAEVELICDSNVPLVTVKALACEKAGIADPNAHRLYKTDWMGCPVLQLDREDKALSACHIGDGDVIVLKDTETGIPKDYVKFEVHITKSGAPQDIEVLDIVAVKEDTTLGDLKKTIARTFENFRDVELARLRFYEIKKYNYFGPILKDNKKTVKKMNWTGTQRLAVRILDGPETLTEDDIVLFLRRRVVDDRSYAEMKEFVVKKVKALSFETLKQAVMQAAGLTSDEGFDMAKYFPFEFSWLVIKKEAMVTSKKRQRDETTAGKKKDGNEGDENLRRSPYLIKDSGNHQVISATK